MSNQTNVREKFLTVDKKEQTVREFIESNLDDYKEYSNDPFTDLKTFQFEENFDDLHNILDKRTWNSLKGYLRVNGFPNFLEFLTQKIAKENWSS